MFHLLFAIVFVSFSPPLVRSDIAGSFGIWLSIYRARLLLLHLFEKAFEISQWYCCDDKCVHGNNARLSFMENSIQVDRVCDGGLAAYELILC